MNNRFLLLLLPMLLCTTVNARKKGKFFKDSDPVCALWRLDVPEDPEEYIDEEAYVDLEATHC